MHFPGLQKSCILGKIDEVMEKSWNFNFWSNILCCLKTGNILLSFFKQNYTPKETGFAAFLSHGKFKSVMEKSWKTH